MVADELVGNTAPRADWRSNFPKPFATNQGWRDRRNGCAVLVTARRHRKCDLCRNGIVAALVGCKHPVLRYDGEVARAILNLGLLC